MFVYFEIYKILSFLKNSEVEALFQKCIVMMQLLNNKINNETHFLKTFFFLFFVIKSSYKHLH